MGDGITRWLRAQTWPPEDVARFTDALADEVARLNHANVERAGQSHAARPRSARGEVLVAGWRGEPYICLVDLDARPKDQSALDFTATGTGGTHATIGWYIAQRLVDFQKPSVTRVKMLTCIIEGVAGHTKFCGLPVHIWRISAKGVTDARNDQPIRP